MSVHADLVEFTLYLESEKGLSSNTISAYASDLKSFFLFLQSLQIQAFNQVSGQELIAYLAFLQEKKYATSTICRALMAIKVLFRFLVRENRIDQNPTIGIDSPKLWQLIPEVLSQEEVDHLLNCPTSDFNGARDKAVLELLYATGIRVSEACALSIYDIDNDFIKVTGKGNKERLIPISKRAINAIDAYLLRFRGQHESENNPTLFLKKNGQPVDRIYLWKMIKRRGKESGINKNISPHTLRHSFATHLLDHGAELRVIQEMLGHSSISTTDRYTHISHTKMQQAFYQYHPRNELTNTNPH